VNKTIKKNIKHENHTVFATIWTLFVAREEEHPACKTLCFSDPPKPLLSVLAVAGGSITSKKWTKLTNY